MSRRKFYVQPLICWRMDSSALPWTEWQVIERKPHAEHEIARSKARADARRIAKALNEADQ